MFTRLLVPLFLFTLAAAPARAQVPEVEPNNAFTTANQMAYAATITGTIYCTAIDVDDYFRVVVPAGTKSLRLITKSKTQSGTGAMYYYLYNKYGTQLTNYYQSFGTTWFTDTLDYPCFEADTFFVRAYHWTGGCKDYEITTGTPAVFLAGADPEVNDDFASATPLAFNFDTSGHLANMRYTATAAVTDVNDYYRVVPPTGNKGLRVVSRWRSATPGTSGTAYVYLYNKFQQQLANNYVSFGDAWVNDTLNYPCFEGDTFYVRMYQWTGDCKEYRLRATTPGVYTVSNDVENNDAFATAVPMPWNTDSSGHLASQRYSATNSYDDVNDYYRVVAPSGNKGLRLATQWRMAAPGGTGTAYVYLYNKFQQQLANNYVSGITNAWKLDTLDYPCFEGDTFYVRIYQWTGDCKEYRMRTMTPGVFTVSNDVENNDDFASAVPIPWGVDSAGHLNSQRYSATGAYNDVNDYYRIVAPASNRSLRLITRWRATAPGSTGTAYVYLYNKFQQQLTNNYVGGITNTWKADTLNYPCFEGDTFYVRIYQWTGDCKEYTYNAASGAVFLAGADAENNDDFATATPTAFNTDTSGHLANQRYGPSNSYTDNNDYHRIIAPAGNRGLRLITQWRTATPGGTGTAYVYLYNKAQQQLANNYVSGITNAWKRDTLDYPCFGGDTFYVRMYQWTGDCKEYRMRVESTFGNTPIVGDVEPNNTIGTAPYVSLADTLRGSVGYEAVGTDGFDYFRFVNPTRSRITAYIAYSNNSGATTSDIYYNFRSKTGTSLAARSALNRPLGAGLDTLVLNCAAADTLGFSLNASGCFTYSVRFAVRDEQPVAKIKAARTGNEVGFVAETQNADTLAWNLGNGQTSSFKYPVKKFAPGVYNIKLKATNRACNLSYTDSLQLEIRGIESYKPKVAGAGGDLLMSVYGGGLTNAVTVSLKKGGTTIVPRSVVPNAVGNMLSVDFDLHFAPTGLYDVEIVIPGEAPVVYPGGLRVDSFSYPYCKAEITGPTQWRINQDVPFELKVTNTGNVYGNGVVVGFVYPKAVKVTFLPKQVKLPQNQSPSFEIDGETFTFSNAATAKYNDSSSKPGSIDLFDGKPYNGYALYLKIPKVPPGATVSIPFKARATSIGTAGFHVYTHHPNVFGSCGTPHWSDQSNLFVAESIDALDMVASEAGPVGVPVKGLVKATKIGQKHLAYSAAYAGAKFDAWWNGYEMTAEMYGNLNAELDEANAFALQTATDEAANLAFDKGLDGLQAANAAKKDWWYKQVNHNYKQGNLSPELLGDFLKKIDGLSASNDRLDKLKAMYKTSKDLKTLVDKINTLQQLAKDCPELQPQLVDLLKLLDEQLDHKDPNDKPTQILGSMDPNAIYGPEGVLTPRFRKGFDVLHYMVTCENVDTATAPAQVVRIVDTLDPAKFDLSTFEFGNVYIGEKSMRLLSGRDQFVGAVNLYPEIPLQARVIAKLDTATGVVTWDMIGIDTNTGALPINPNLGLLPPNVASNRPIGEAAVSYSVRLKAGLPSGTQVRNSALIYFDENEPIATNVWSNTLDIVQPQSSVAATLEADTIIRLRFTGADAESGVAKYRLYVKTDTGAWYRIGITDADTMTMTGNRGTTYRFYATSLDNVGNEELKTARTESEVTLPGIPGEPGNTGAFGVYPNPARGTVNVSVGAVDEGELLVVFTTPIGTRAMAWSTAHGGGPARYTVPLGSMAPGVYFVKASVGGKMVGEARLVVVP